MDTITTAIVTVLTADSTGSRKLALEAYETLKLALRRKYGVGSDVIGALDMLEKQPASTGRQTVLKEELAAGKAEQDPALRVLAQSLLDKIKTTPSSTVPHPTKSAAPLQRPRQAESFAGREPELAQLLADLQPGQVVALCGPAGIGKSALAAAAVWKLAPGQSPPSAFPDGIFYHNFYNQPRVDITMNTLIRFKTTPRTIIVALMKSRAGFRLTRLDSRRRIGAITPSPTSRRNNFALKSPVKRCTCASRMSKSETLAIK